MDHLGNQSSPAALVRSTETTTSVSIKELMEPQVILPMLVKVKEIRSGISSPTPFIVSGKQMLQPVLNLFRDVAQMHIIARARRALDLERIAVEHVKPEQGLDQQEIDTEPDWAPPVAVPPKESTVRVARYVAHREHLAIDFHGVRVFFVVLGHRPDAVIGKELGFVKHPLENFDQSVFANEG